MMHVLNELKRRLFDKNEDYLIKTKTIDLHKTSLTLMSCFSMEGRGPVTQFVVAGYSVYQPALLCMRVL